MPLFTFSLVPVSSAKKLPQTLLILRTPCLILRLCSPLSMSSSLCAKPIFRNNVTLYKSFTDPCPHFAVSETQKFKAELLKKLLEEKDEFGDKLDAIFFEFLCKEYGGPGTLLVEPFTDMLFALKKSKLPVAPLAARASLLCAQHYVDKDWEVWNSKLK